MATGPEMMAMTALKMALPSLLKNPEFMARIEKGLAVIETVDARAQMMERQVSQILNLLRDLSAKIERAELRSQGYDEEQVKALMQPVGEVEATMFRRYEQEHAG